MRQTLSGNKDYGCVVLNVDYHILIVKNHHCTQIVAVGGSSHHRPREGQRNGSGAPEEDGAIGARQH